MASWSNTVVAQSKSDDARERLFADYHAQYLVLFPLEATNFGESQYNDQLPIDIGEEFLRKTEQFYRVTLARLSEIDLSSAKI